MLSNENTTEFSALAASSYSNNTTINTSSEKIDDFTLMIYIIGSDLETKSYEATKDINEMIKGNLTRPNINLILQTGGAPEKTDEIRKIDFSKVQRHQIYDHKINTLDNLGSVNMGDVTTLSNFINWTVTNYPAKKYGLILWDHGAGIKGFGKDTNFEGDAIHLTEFISLQNLPIEVSNFEKFEFIGFDSCLMATAEISHILRSISNFLVSSQEIEPDWGWNYTDIINSISSNSNTTGDFIGKQIIKSYIKDSQRISKEKEYHADRDITLSVIDLKRIPAFDKKMDELIQDAIKELKNQNSHFKVMQTVDLTESFGKTAESSIGVIDLSDFLNNLLSAFPSLKEKINSVKKEMQAVIVNSHSGESHPNANGLSIYFPLTKEEFGVITELQNRFGVPAFTYSVNWTNFINLVGIIVNSDQKPTMIQSNRIGDTISVRTFEPDIESIYAHFIFNSTQGRFIQYIQQLDPSLLDINGFFKYDQHTMLVLCNDRECIPVSMIMDVMKDLKKIFIPVQIEPKAGQNKSVSLTYELYNNEFIFLGALDEYNIKGGATIPKEKISLNKGDKIIPKQLKYDNHPYYVSDTETIHKRIINSFNALEHTKYLEVEDPLKIRLRIIDVNQSQMQFSFCDYSNKCEQTRTYYIDEKQKKDSSYSSKKENYTQPLVAKSLINNNSNNTYLYVNDLYNFRLKIPSNWFSITADMYDYEKMRLFMNDPMVVSFYPMDEIIKGNGSEHSLRTTINIGIQEVNPDTNFKRYFEYFKDLPRGEKTTIKKVLPYTVINSSKGVIDGNPSYEFILEYQKSIPIYQEKDEKRLLYFASTIIENKEYVIGFEAAESKFDKYLPIIRKIINSFEVSQSNITKIDESNYTIIDEKKKIQEAKKILQESLQKNLVWKEYEDPLYHFKIKYPFIDNFNKPVSERIIPITNIMIPTIDYFESPFTKPIVSISVIPLYDAINYSDPKTLLQKLDSIKNPTINTIVFMDKKMPNYKLLNKTLEPMIDNNLTVINQEKYFLPLYNSMVYQKHAYSIIDDKLVSIKIIIPYNIKFYESLFDEIVKSFELKKVKKTYYGQ